MSGACSDRATSGGGVGPNVFVCILRHLVKFALSYLSGGGGSHHTRVFFLWLCVLLSTSFNQLVVVHPNLGDLSRIARYLR